MVILRCCWIMLIGHRKSCRMYFFHLSDQMIFCLNIQMCRSISVVAGVSNEMRSPDLTVDEQLMNG